MDANKWDVLPSSKILAGQGYYGIINSIMTYHGGFHEVRIKLGEEPLRARGADPPIKKKKTANRKRKTAQERRFGWKNLEYCISYATSLKDYNGWDCLPGSDRLDEMGQSSFVAAIYRYQGGFLKFRRELGEIVEEPEETKWKNRKFVYKAARSFLRKYGFEELPSQTKIEELGSVNLASAIRNYFGGILKFRKYMSLREKHKFLSDGSLENLLERYTNG